MVYTLLLENLISIQYQQGTGKLYLNSLSQPYGRAVVCSSASPSVFAPGGGGSCLALKVAGVGSAGCHKGARAGGQHLSDRRRAEGISS